MPLHETTEELLRECALSTHRKTGVPHGRIPYAIKRWKDAGCPDAPEPRNPQEILNDLLNSLTLQELGDLTPDESRDAIKRALGKAQRDLKGVSRGKSKARS